MFAEEEAYQVETCRVSAHAEDRLQMLEMLVE
jgi:hypothetical protein